MSYLATYSIVALDAEMGEFGVAVQSRAFRAGAIVPHAKAGVGAIASQALANLSYGPKGLALLEAGLSAAETLEKLISEDEHREHRQLAVIDSQGRIAQHTGRECLAWAGHRAGASWAAQGNILASSEVIAAMGEAFEKTDGILAERLMAALEAAQAAGGDRRGQQAGAILVVRANAYFDGPFDRLVDIRVDDHPEPIRELRRLLEIALPSVYLLNTRFFLERRAPERARALLDRASRKNPQQPLVRLALVGYYAQTQQPSQALREIELLLAHAPSEDRESMKRYLRTNAFFAPLHHEREFQRLTSGY
ncbi:MAG: DUF1028 domain-containing protein [Candidatus Bipolaricaulota bacterium]|nr:DUF1028 domain-containing protein [Candidatus Bipolaricaulota bacterium]MCS7274848.1 DUF1028 domain-containing protein [Candidatus Bipolaricaulota bacterium]MDW8111269.1 DUF1028 domain-containing protein [Candidatus Bipolaricaulota bacterium]MDW8328595.1 DUF1028 domain-containing protein [Candidatus Bipolaricaulota bacterium]